MRDYLLITIFLCIIGFIPSKTIASYEFVIKNIEIIISKDIQDYPIDQFIDDCINSTKNLKTCINSILKNKKVEIDKKELNLTLNNIDLINSQITILNKLKIFKPTLPFTLPKKQKPPYSIDLFKQYISLLRDINLSISENQRLNEDVKDKLEAIKKNCKSLIDDYLKQKENLTIFQKYNRLTSILSLKIQNIILYKKREYYQLIIAKLKEQKSKLTERINYIFKNLKITQLDIKNIKHQKDILNSQLQSEKAKILEQQRDIDKKIIYYEIKLQSLQNKINSKKSNLNKELLKIDEKRIKSLINYYNLKKSYLSQKILNTELKKRYYDFYYLWLVEYKKIKAGSSDNTIFKSIDELTESIKQKFNLTIENLADIRKAKINLEQSLAINTQKIKQLKDEKLKQAIYNLNYELKRQSKLIDNIVFLLIQNKHKCSEFLNEASLISSLLKNMSGWIRSLNVWSKEKFLDLYQKVKFVVFYPFAKIGNLDLSIATILKIVLLFVLGFIILRQSRKKITSLMQQKTKLSLGTINSITTLGYYFSLVLLVLIVLSTAGIDLTQLNILMGALGVGIGFGLQTIANNFISGLIILTDRSIQVGDIVELEDGTIGTVKSLAIRATVIKTFDGKDIIVPNSELVSSRVNTWTYSDDWRRLTIPFGVSYNADPEEVKEIAIEAAREVSITREDKDHPIQVWFEEFGDNSINFSLKVWCRINQLSDIKTGIHSDYYYALFKRLKEANIEIPFPQRDLYVKSLPDNLTDFLRDKEKN
ncbi:mechanosensitive ion channel domain-containing protein [Desulfothermus sp.]